MDFKYYQDKYFYYFRKPTGIPSTFGSKKSFLELLLESKDQDIQNIIKAQKTFFDKDQEYGLLNRLDNDTSGLLYFAKNPLAKEKYKQAQGEGKIKKYYIADVYGKISFKNKKVDYPIGHHKFSPDRMVVFSDTKQSHKIKGKAHNVQTTVELLYYDLDKNISTVFVTISKGIRHQIRAHLSSIGYPIVGEQIYINKKKDGILHLFSIGFSLK
ncbi:MAG TPA: RNA pseudouridine synthase [Candidatus Absconditabacterales bacterium]|nr:RNA pseudouridine synthase [Candidatus Absconditabacterales bacterium]